MGETTLDEAPLRTAMAGSSRMKFEEAEDARFAVIGCFGADTIAERNVAALVKSWEVDFVITTGDNRIGRNSQYQNTVGRSYYYCDFMTGGITGCHAAINSFYPVPGEGDYYGRDGILEYKYFFDLPGAHVRTSGTSKSDLYYDYIRGNVHFFALDSEGMLQDTLDCVGLLGCANPVYDMQRKWLERQLKRSKSEWKVVYLSHSPYSSSGERHFHGSNQVFQWPFEKWGVDVVFSAHDHHYERVHNNGVLYIVSGLGGAPLHRLWHEAVEGSEFRYNRNHGALLVTAGKKNEEGMHIQFFTHEGEMVDDVICTHEGCAVPRSNDIMGTFGAQIDLAGAFIGADVVARAPIESFLLGGSHAAFGLVLAGGTCALAASLVLLGVARCVLLRRRQISLSMRFVRLGATPRIGQG